MPNYFICGKVTLRYDRETGYRRLVFLEIVGCTDEATGKPDASGIANEFVGREFTKRTATTKLRSESRKRTEGTLNGMKRLKTEPITVDVKDTQPSITSCQDIATWLEDCAEPLTFTTAAPVDTARGVGKEINEIFGDEGSNHERECGELFDAGQTQKQGIAKQIQHCIDLCPTLVALYGDFRKLKYVVEALIGLFVYGFIESCVGKNGERSYDIDANDHQHIYGVVKDTLDLKANHQPHHKPTAHKTQQRLTRAFAYMSLLHHNKDIFVTRTSDAFPKLEYEDGTRKPKPKQTSHDILSCFQFWTNLENLPKK